MRLREALNRLLAEGHARDHASIDPGQDFTLSGDAHAPSAVLVAITDRAEPGVILTKRSAALRKHAGQVAFPGGRMDPGDADVVATALREAEEEIALPPAAVDILGTTDPYRTATGFAIVPVVGVIPPDLPLVPCPGEVDAIFEVPLSYLLDPDRRTRHRVQVDGQGERHYHEILWQDWRIWGVTAAMIVNLSHRLDRFALRAMDDGR